MMYVGWDGVKRKVVHTFIKASVFGNLDTGGFQVVPNDILRCVGEKTEENATARGDLEFGRTSARRSDPNVASESTEMREVVDLASSEGQGRLVLVFGRNSIFDTEIMVECIGPESRRGTSSVKHGSDSVGNSKMSAFHRTVLVGSIGSGGANFIMKFFEECTNVRVVVEFATLVKIDVFVGHARGVVCEKMTKPVQWCCFGDTCVTMKSTGKVIGDEDPRSLAM